MCLAQGPQRSDAGEARIRGPSVSSQALYHWATALPSTATTTLVLFIRAYFLVSTVLINAISGKYCLGECTVLMNAIFG